MGALVHVCVPVIAEIFRLDDWCGPLSVKKKSNVSDCLFANNKVGRIIRSCAHAKWMTMLLLMDLVLEECKLNPPDYASIFPVFDGTREKLKFVINGRTIQQSMEIFVIRVIVVYGHHPIFNQVLIQAAPLPICVDGTTIYL